MNWGYGIVLGLLAFMSYIITLGVIMATSNNEKPEKDYYEKDLKYQKVIESKENLSHLKDKIKIEYMPSRKAIKVEIPLQLRRAKGMVYFIKPDASEKDFNLPLELDEKNEQEINVKDLEKGNWKVDVEVKSEDKEYKSDSWNLKIE